MERGKRRFVFVLATVLTALTAPLFAVTAADKELKVAMFLWRGQTAAETAFLDTLKKAGYSVKATIFDAKQDIRALRGPLDELKGNPRAYDYVYTFGTTVSKAVKENLNGAVPQIFNIVVDPVRCGLVDNVTRPGGNITGVSNETAVGTQLDNAIKLLKPKTLGIIVNPGDEAARIAAAAMRKAAAARGVECREFLCQANRVGLDALMVQISRGEINADAVFLPNSGFLISNAKTICPALLKRKVAAIGSIGEYVDAGAAMGTVPDYERLGAMAAKIVIANRKGKPLNAISVKTDPDPEVQVNANTIDALKIKIPAGMKVRVIK